jgi:hypothetical protein
MNARCYFNRPCLGLVDKPETNLRNMEFDPKQNLFKNLKPLEQIAAP